MPINAPTASSTPGRSHTVPTTGDDVFFSGGGTTYYSNADCTNPTDICGNGGCVERVVNDYGPIRTSRIVDLYRADFFDVCGCAWWSGTTPVAVSVY